MIVSGEFEMAAAAAGKRGEGKKRGRKASGLRNLPPEAAAFVLAGASLQAVRAAVALRETMRKETGMAGGLPTLERLMRADVAMARINVPEAGELGLKPVLRAASLEQQLRAAGFDDRAAWVGERFARDVEAMTIGKLTASYGEGCGGATSAEPLRVVAAMDRVRRATESLTRRERLCVWSVLVFGVNMTDTGWALVGRQFGGRGEPLRNAAWLYLDAALERMAPYYERLGE